MFQPVIFRLSMRYILRRFSQSILFILGVALGVAVVIAIDIANDSANRAFELSSRSVTGNTTHQIIGTMGGIEEDLYTKIRVDLGIRKSAPVISEMIYIDQVPQPLQLLGVDPFAEPPFRAYLSTVEVLGEQNINGIEALTRFITEPNTVIISESLAGQLGIQPGDSLTLLSSGDASSVRVVGMLRPNDDLSRQALENLVMTDLATAQELSKQPGRISRIDLILDGSEQIEAIQGILPANTTLTSVAESSGALSQMTEAFQINLQALSLLAVVVGVFLIYNTVTFSVVQRRPILGILRSIGMTRQQIFSFIIGEALILGLIGTILGIGLGVIFGRFMVQAVSRTINDLYFAVSVTRITVAPLTLFKGVFLGIVTSAIAAFIPAIDAIRTPPAGSMQRSSLEEKTAQRIPWITAAAVLFLLLGLGILQIPTTNLGISFSALFCIIFGGALLTPFVLVTSMRLLSPVLYRLFGVLGQMASRAIIRSISRTSIAVAALTIAVSVIVGVSIMIGSFRNTVANWLENTLAADIYIAPPGINANQSIRGLNPELREQITAVPGVMRVSTARDAQVIAPQYPDLPAVNLTAVDFDLAGAARDYLWLQTDDPQTALDQGLVMVSEPFAFRRNITPENNRITLLTDEGERVFEVFGVFYDYSTDQGVVVIGRSSYDQFWDDPYISALAAFIEPEEEVNDVVDRIEERLSGYDVVVQSNRDLRANVFAIFDRTFTITIALRLLATLVAFIGILAALMSLQLENTRQYGVMRATGMTPGQLQRFTFLQTGLMGIVAGVLAIPLGLTLALVLVYVINVRSFGWTMQFDIIPTEIAEAFAVAIGASLLAGVYPAFKLAQINISRAIRSE